MSAKLKTEYICSNCGYKSAKWYGKCPECGQWNTFEENIVQTDATIRSSVIRAISKPQSLSEIKSDQINRLITGFSEFDRVLGGGIVPGSVVLICGEPGIGKSTILLQISDILSVGRSILYVTGEESKSQLKLRAERIHNHADNLLVLAENDLELILDSIRSIKPDLVIVDSIQTMVYSQLSSVAGSVTQVRYSAQEFINLAKENSIPMLLVGHVNKDGAIAGPKVLEHMVDTVLYFEGDRNFSYRILRATKNRFGPTNEIGVFEMFDDGLHEVENPSQMLLSGRSNGVSGTCVSCIMEGSRPLLVEIQALASKSAITAPRRTATGIDYNRLLLLLAVLEKRCGYYFGSLDVFINVVGGIEFDEPAADLPTCLALISCVSDKTISNKVAAMGEVGLAGEVRGISNVSKRITEAFRLGFKCCIVPKQNESQIGTIRIPDDCRILFVDSVMEANRVLKDLVED